MSHSVVKSTWYTIGAAISLFPNIALANTTSQGLRSLVEGGLNNVSGAFTADKPRDLIDIIGLGISIILGLVGVFFVIQIIVAGFQWMSAGGNEDQVTSAKTRIQNSTFGIVIIFAAYIISAFVLTQVQTLTIGQ